ncbi:hypothetical protein [Nonlabens xiamenensis]|uniref:hypothetical protein n=1 Tax=Nonlabens xiamenensis TaxID=2341043 RepID=UPI000F607C77|nr:hypothetical protein [Nonlabens xiamenensis]
MSENKFDYKSIVLSAAFGGMIYAILMSVWYQFVNEEPFSILKFVIDFFMFGLLIAGIIWWSMRGKNKEK